MKKLIKLLILLVAVFVLGGSPAWADDNGCFPPTPPGIKTVDIDTLAELNTIIGDATLLDDGAISDSTAIGLNTGATYTNFGVAGDDSLNEIFAAIDTAIGTKEPALTDEASLYSTLSDVTLFLEDLVDDTTPELGGDLGLNTHEIEIKDTDSLHIASATNGAVAPEGLSVLTSTNTVEGRNFSGTANEDVQYRWTVPFDFTGSTINVAVKNWVSNATGPATSEVVAYSITASCVGVSELLSTAQGSAATSSFTVSASPTYVQYDSLDTAYVAVTPGGSIAAGEECFIDVIRLATSTDTYGQDILQEKVLVKYSRKLTND